MALVDGMYAAVNARALYATRLPLGAARSALCTLEPYLLIAGCDADEKTGIYPCVNLIKASSTVLQPCTLSINVAPLIGWRKLVKLLYQVLTYRNGHSQLAFEVILQ